MNNYDDLNNAERCESFLSWNNMSDDQDIELSNAMLKADYLPYCKSFAEYVNESGRTGQTWSADDYIGYHGKIDYKALANVISGMYGTKLYDAYSEFVENALCVEAEDAHDNAIIARYEMERAA